MVLCTGCPGPNNPVIIPTEDTTVVYNPLTPESNHYVHLYNIGNQCIGKSQAEVETIFTREGFEKTDFAANVADYAKEQSIGQYEGVLNDQAVLYFNDNDQAVSVLFATTGAGRPTEIPTLADANLLVKGIGAKTATTQGDQLRFVTLYPFGGKITFKYDDVPSMLDGLDLSGGSVSYLAIWAGYGYTLDIEDLENILTSGQNGSVSMVGMIVNAQEQTKEEVTTLTVQTQMLISTAKLGRVETE